MSKRKTTGKILQKGDIGLIFRCFDIIQHDHRYFFTKEEQVREHFDIPLSHKCVDAAIHYLDCSWWLAEDDGVSVYNALKQMEATLDFFYKNKHEVRRTTLFVKRVKFAKKFGCKGILLVDKTKKDAPFKAKHYNCHLYVVKYGTPLKFVEGELAKIEGKKVHKQIKRKKDKEVESKNGRLY